MSAPGIGVGDIVGGGKFVYKAIGAVCEGNAGSRHHYQQTKTGLAHRVRALNELSDSLVDTKTGPAVLAALDIVKNGDNALQIDLSRFEGDLGRGGKKGLSRGITNKIKFAFDDDKRVREQNDRTRPAVDAAMLQVLKTIFDTTKEVSEAHSRELKTSREYIVQQMQASLTQPGFSALEQQVAQLRIDLLTKQTLQTRPRYSSKTQRLAGPAMGFNKRAGTQDELPLNPPARTASQPSSSVSGASEVVRALDYFANSVARLWNKGSDLTPLSSSDDAATQPISGLIHVILAIIVTATYQVPIVRKLIVSQLKAAQEDPVIATLLCGIIFNVARAMSRVPRLIVGMSDDSLSLQTALGEELKVPSLYWASFPTFHGFLESHFQNRPGNALVSIKRYRILLGGTGGVVIDDWKWSTVISKHMKLTMAMLLNESRYCPRCREELNFRSTTEKFCQRCAESFWSIQNESGSHARAKEAVQSSMVRNYGPDTRDQASDVYWNTTAESIRSTFDETALFVNILLCSMDRGRSSEADAGVTPYAVERSDTNKEDAFAEMNGSGKRTRRKKRRRKRRRSNSQVTEDFPQRPPMNASRRDSIVMGLLRLSESPLISKLPNLPAIEEFIAPSKFSTNRPTKHSKQSKAA